MADTTHISSPDLKDPDLYVNQVPYEVFARLRREQPVYWNAEKDGPGFWALTRQAEISLVSRDPKLFSSAYENGGHRIFNENEVGLTGAGESAIYFDRSSDTCAIPQDHHARVNTGPFGGN